MEWLDPLVCVCDSSGISGGVHIAAHDLCNVELKPLPHAHLRMPLVMSWDHLPSLHGNALRMSEYRPSSPLTSFRQFALELQMKLHCTNIAHLINTWFNGLRISSKMWSKEGVENTITHMHTSSILDMYVLRTCHCFVYSHCGNTALAVSAS